jgi:hypothetical protein
MERVGSAPSVIERFPDRSPLARNESTNEGLQLHRRPEPGSHGPAERMIMADDPARDEPAPTAEDLVEDAIKLALQPYEGKLRREVLDHMADELRVFFFTHPVASRMVSRVQPDDRTRSGDQPSQGAAQPLPLASRKGNVG